MYEVSDNSFSKVYRVYNSFALVLMSGRLLLQDSRVVLVAKAQLVCCGGCVACVGRNKLTSVTRWRPQKRSELGLVVDLSTNYSRVEVQRSQARCVVEQRWAWA